MSDLSKRSFPLKDREDKNILTWIRLEKKNNLVAKANVKVRENAMTCTII